MIRRFSFLLLLPLAFSTLAQSQTAHKSSLTTDFATLCTKSVDTTAQREAIKKQAPELAKKYLTEKSNKDEVQLLYTIATSPTPVIVKFYADWCPPCKKMQPIVEKVAKKFENQLQIIEINSDYYMDLSNMFNIRGLPTLIFFKNQREVERTHSMKEDEMMTKVTNFLAAK